MNPFAQAKPVPHPFAPIVGKVMTPRQAAEGWGRSTDTIVRWIKSGELKGFVTGLTKDGRPQYGTTDFYCAQRFKRLNRDVVQ